MLGIAPSPIVVDASVAVALVAEDDDRVDAAWARWISEGRMLLAPAHLWPEVGNGLLRGRRVALLEADAMLEDLAISGLETADRGADGARAALALADRHGLTIHDALYLSLAIDVDGKLATRDAALVRAALAEGVPLELA